MPVSAREHVRIDNTGHVKIRGAEFCASCFGRGLGSTIALVFGRMFRGYEKNINRPAIERTFNKVVTAFLSLQVLDLKTDDHQLTVNLRGNGCCQTESVSLVSLEVS